MTGEVPDDAATLTGRAKQSGDRLRDMMKVVECRTVSLCCTHYLANAVSWLTRPLPIARRRVSPYLAFG
jgi:hypothetical protein